MARPRTRCSRCAYGHRKCNHFQSRPTLKPTKNYRSRSHLIIPDVQAKDGVPLDHLTWIGKYIAEKRPDVIVCLGDFCDLESLNSYDKGKLAFEGRRFKKDVAVAKKAMGMLVSPFRGIKGYKPKMVLTLGNHEDRITRAIEDNPVLEGTIGIEDLGYEDAGWEVHDFLDPVSIDGIEYAHYFTSGKMGRPVSSAKAMLAARMSSAIMGHTQVTDAHFHPQTQKIGIFAGCCYQHDEDYLGIQGNVVRRQILMLYEIDGQGSFDPQFISLNFLRRKFAGLSSRISRHAGIVQR